VELKLFFYRLTKKFHRVVKKKKNVHNIFFSFLILSGRPWSNRMHASISRLLFNLPTPRAYAIAARAWERTRPWVTGGATPSPATGDNSR
jgi:hypothetical protein